MPTEILLKNSEVKKDVKNDIVDEIEEITDKNEKNLLNDFMNLVPEDTTKFILSVFKMGKVNNRGFLKELFLDEFENEILSLKEIKENYGGGEYIIRLRVKTEDNDRSFQQRLFIAEVVNENNNFEMQKSNNNFDNIKEILEIANLSNNSNNNNNNANIQNQLMLTMFQESQKQNNNLLSGVLSQNNNQNNQSNDLEVFMSAIQFSKEFNNPQEEKKTSSVQSITEFLGHFVRGYMGKKSTNEKEAFEEIDESNESSISNDNDDKLLNKYDDLLDDNNLEKEINPKTENLEKTVGVDNV